ncbi:MAG: phosphoglycerate dehydrogenase [Actinomycetaceae bacterium]|nr:phosphoglycerate dehydrogenase [Actinomycetaceae bacterium]
MTQVVLFEDPHEVADNHFVDANINVTRINGSVDEDQLIEILRDADMVGIRSKTSLTRRVLESCPRLSAIGAYCIGTNQIDIPVATENGVAIFNAPYSNTRSVVELVISDIIALTRRIPPKNSALQRGQWQKTATGSHEVRGKTLGIIGYGNIGTQLSVLAEALGMKVIFYDRAERLAMGNAIACKTQEEVLQQADVVSLHVDGRQSNINMFGEQQFAQMKPGALFINLARGFVVDIDALAKNLESGHIAGAAVDVFPEEPKKNGDPFESPLLGFDNTILTPHIGGSTLEAQYDIGKFVSGKLVDYVLSGSTDMSVNIPNLTLPTSDVARYRVALIHRNNPGVLALVNQTFAEQGVNITGQILGTEGSIGYVLTDISSELPVEAVTAIRDMEETINTRVLTTPHA